MRRVRSLLMPCCLGIAAVLTAACPEAAMAQARKRPASAPSKAGFIGADGVGPPALIPVGDPASSEFIGPVLAAPFEILGTQVLPGKRARLEWNAGMNFSGSEVVSPVVVIQGVRPGPVLCLTAGIHGDELNGVEVVRRIAADLDPADLSGTVIAVPVVNLFGFSRNSRYLPDRRDLNRFFPGSRHGSIASRIANSFFTSVVQHCDALVDLHTGSFDRRNLPQVRADLGREKVRLFAHGFGTTPVLHSVGARGMLRTAALQAGIPAVTFEVGGPGELEAAEIAHGIQALQTLLHSLGMTRHQPSRDQPQPIFYDSVWVRAEAGGVLFSRVALGEVVEKGQVLGVLIDPINNIEREMISPVQGTVLGMARNQVVLPGFAAYRLGEQTSEQKAVREARLGSPGAEDEDDTDAPARVPEGAGARRGRSDPEAR